jgi:hypothetical protein
MLSSNLINLFMVCFGFSSVNCEVLKFFGCFLVCLRLLFWCCYEKLMEGFEAYIQGPLANIQRYFSRALETQWYPSRVKLALAKNGYQGDAPVVVKQVWNPIRTSDVNDMARSVASLYAGGSGILAEHEDIAFDMMGWPKENLEQNQAPTQPAQPKPKTDKPLPGQESLFPDVNQNGSYRSNDDNCRQN